MENRQRSHNEPQISINRFAGPAQRRRLPDSVRLPKRRRRRRRKIRNQLLFLSAALIVLIAVVILIVLVVRACSGGRTKTLDGKSAPDNTAVYSFEGAGKRDTLCGKWDLDGTTVYVFDGKGRGALELPENKYDFRYEIKDGTVNIDFSDDKIRDISYKFTINSDELTLERKEKKDIVIHKFKKQTDHRYE